LILGKISKSSATRCQILRLKCTKFDFHWAPPQTPLEELTTLPQTPYLCLRGPTFKGGKERERKKEIVKKERRERDRKRGENDLTHPLSQICLFIYLFSSSTSNGIEVQAKNILAEWPTQG